MRTNTESSASKRCSINAGWVNTCSMTSRIKTGCLRLFCSVAVPGEKPKRPKGAVHEDQCSKPRTSQHEVQLLPPYLPLSKVISQFRPPMLVSQERMIRPPLDTVIASGKEKNTVTSSPKLVLCSLLGPVSSCLTSDVWMWAGTICIPVLSC